MEIIGLFSRTPETFEFSGSPEQAARRLSSLIRSSVFKTWRTEAVIGRATPDRVVLYRHRPFVRNSFIPRFVGRFVVENGRTLLSGSFSIHPLVRWFMVVWFSFLLIASLGFLSTLAGAHGGTTPLIILVPLGMMLFGAALVRFSRWWARTDIAYIGAVVRRAARMEAA